MLERDLILKALWARMASVAGVMFTARNPVNPPNKDNMPCIQFFELDDLVTDITKRGGLPAHKRELELVIEMFILASSEPAATKELAEFVGKVKYKLYEGGVTLGLKGVELREVSTGQILRPPDLDLAIGVGIVLKIRYVEEISKLVV